jgi:hypothetical protein
MRNNSNNNLPSSDYYQLYLLLLSFYEQKLYTDQKLVRDILLISFSLSADFIIYEPLSFIIYQI